MEYLWLCALFQYAKGLYAQGNIQGAFDLYQRSVKKILREKNVPAKIPAIIMSEFPGVA